MKIPLQKMAQASFTKLSTYIFHVFLILKYMYEYIHQAAKIIINKCINNIHVHVHVSFVVPLRKYCSNSNECIVQYIHV